MRPAPGCPLIVTVVSDEVATVLAEPDPPRLERLLENPDALDLMTGRSKPQPKGKSIDKVGNGKARGRDGEGGFPWEGPKIRFTLFLGEDAIWTGPDSLTISADGGVTWECPFCGSLRKLPEIACCLGCDRTGQDARIGKPTELDLKRRPPEKRSYRRGNLKGGTGN